MYDSVVCKRATVVKSDDVEPECQGKSEITWNLCSSTRYSWHEITCLGRPGRVAPTRLERTILPVVDPDLFDPGVPDGFDLPLDIITGTRKRRSPMFRTFARAQIAKASVRCYFGEPLHRRTFMGSGCPDRCRWIYGGYVLCRFLHPSPVP